MGPPIMLVPLPKIVTKLITHFFFKSISILLRRFIPLTIVNSDHAAEASMLWKIKHNATY